MNAQFAPGMNVRYKSYGICLIDRIEDVVYPDGEPRHCYVLKPRRNQFLEISVSVDSSENLKPLLTKTEIDNMLSDAVADQNLTWNPERKLRGSEFRKIIASGDARDLLRMIHCILSQKHTLEAIGKHLSAADDSFRRDAERILDEEFGFSLGISAEEVGSYIRAHLTPTAV